MQRFIIATIIACVVSSALSAPATGEKKRWEQQLTKFAQSFDLVDYGSYRAGLINTDELAVRVASAFNAAAYRDVANCTNTQVNGVYTFNCGLTVPVVGQIAAIELSATATDVSLVLIIAGQRITLKQMPLADLYAQGMDISISDQLSKFGPPGIGAISSMLVADIVITAKANNNGTSDVCLNFKVGIQGPFGIQPPGMPAPTTINLTCQNIELAQPDQGFFANLCRFFKKVINVVSFGFFFAT